MVSARASLVVAALLGGSAAAQMLAGFDARLTAWRLSWLIVAIVTVAAGAWKSLDPTGALKKMPSPGKASFSHLADWHG